MSCFIGNEQTCVSMKSIAISKESIRKRQIVFPGQLLPANLSRLYQQTSHISIWHDGFNEPMSLLSPGCKCALLLLCIELDGLQNSAVFVPRNTALAQTGTNTNRASVTENKVIANGLLLADPADGCCYCCCFFCFFLGGGQVLAEGT